MIRVRFISVDRGGSIPTNDRGTIWGCLLLN